MNFIVLSEDLEINFFKGDYLRVSRQLSEEFRTPWNLGFHGWNLGSIHAFIQQIFIEGLLCSRY